MYICKDHIEVEENSRNNKAWSTRKLDNGINTFYVIFAFVHSSKVLEYYEAKHNLAIDEIREEMAVWY